MYNFVGINRYIFQIGVIKGETLTVIIQYVTRHKRNT